MKRKCEKQCQRCSILLDLFKCVHSHHYYSLHEIRTDNAGNGYGFNHELRTNIDGNIS